MYVLNSTKSHFASLHVFRISCNILRAVVLRVILDDVCIFVTRWEGEGDHRTFQIFSTRPKAITSNTFMNYDTFVFLTAYNMGGRYYALEEFIHVLYFTRVTIHISFYHYVYYISYHSNRLIDLRTYTKSRPF